jgi:pilus assembly protein CpaB
MGRRVIAIVLALVVATIGAGAVVAYASSADQRAVAGQQVRTVYITQSPVPRGTAVEQALADQLIVPERVVAKGVPAGALAGLTDAIRSQVALSTIPAGEIVLASQFGALSKDERKAGPVPKGKVAVTVNLPDPQRIAPLLEPGAHLVVYDTFNAREADAATPETDGGHLRDDPPGVRATRVLLPDVEVIAVGSQLASVRDSADSSSSASPSGSDPTAAGQSGNSALVTVAVSPRDAIRLVHGIQTGTLYAGLRGEDVKVGTGKGVDDKTILGH